MKYELNQIILADCMDVTRDIPDKYFELAIVDPPYGIGMMDSDNKSRSKLATARDYKKLPDGNPPPPLYFSELMRLSKNQIIFGANHFIENFVRNSPCWIVWDKNNGNNDFADCEIAWTSFHSAIRKFKYTWNGMLQENMTSKEIRIHPTQKPVALYRWLLQNYAKTGDKIIDTHSGSGSCAIACHIEKHDFLAIEKDPDYHAASVKRLEEVRAQGVLF